MNSNQLEHKGTVMLETKRLILRRFVLSDAQAMFKNWANDKRVVEFLFWEPHKTIDATVAYLTSLISEYSSDETYKWVIVLKETDEPIGAIDVDWIEEKDKKCEIGYCLSPAHWGKGLMTEAVSRVIEFLFTEVGINRIQAQHDTMNPGSGRVLEKAGMKLEGTLRHRRIRQDGTYADGHMRAIIRADWKE